MRKEHEEVKLVTRVSFITKDLVQRYVPKEKENEWNEVDMECPDSMPCTIYDNMDVISRSITANWIQYSNEACSYIYCIYVHAWTWWGGIFFNVFNEVFALSCVHEHSRY